MNSKRLAARLALGLWIASSASAPGAPVFAGATGQLGDAAEPIASRSFSPLAADSGAGTVFTVPLAHGRFADLEMATTSEGTTRVEVDVFEDGALRQRRVTVVVARRVLVVSELFELTNLLDLGGPLVVRVSSDEPLRVILVRGD